MDGKKFAEKTDVTVSKSRAELEDMLMRYGATSTAVFNGPAEAAIAFEMEGRRILMRLGLPDASDEKFLFAVMGFRGKKRRSVADARKAWDQACRQKWRALVLAVKAKLVAVEEGVETLEEAFMAHVVMPDGQTVADHVRPRIAQSYRENTMAPLLPAPGAKQ